MSASWEGLVGGTTPPAVFAWHGDPERDLVDEAEDVGLETLTLDTRGAESRDDVYAAMVRDWSLPDWFGRNLDAVWDVLGERTVEPLLLVWDGSRDLAAHDPETLAVLIGLLRDVVGQAGWFAVVLRDAVPPGEGPVSGLDALL